MAEQAGLENRNTCKRIEGSNPSLSARYAPFASAFSHSKKLPKHARWAGGMNSKLRSRSMISQNSLLWNGGELVLDFQ